MISRHLPATLGGRDGQRVVRRIGELSRLGRGGKLSAMMGSSERFSEITEHGVITAPSGAGAVVIHAEEGRDCLVVLAVIRLTDRARKVAIVTLKNCMQFRATASMRYCPRPGLTG
jgi:hypothetical protein